MSSKKKKNKLVSNVDIDFDSITALFQKAQLDGRFCLFEHETYQLLKNSGAETPPGTLMLNRGDKFSDEELTVLPGDYVVLKVVSPFIIHKSEIAGVKVVENTPPKIRSAWRKMMYEVPEKYAEIIEKHPDHAPAAYVDLRGEELKTAIADDIAGGLMVQFIPPDSEAFGNEIIVGLRNSREFGMIISAGLGGTDTELYASRFRKGQAVVAASTEGLDGPTFFELFQKTICYKKLAGLTRGQRRIVTDEQIVECFSSMIDIANYYSPTNPDAPNVIQELEINPFAFSDFLMIPLDGMCRFSEPQTLPVSRPFWKVDNLLHPKSIGIMGVSTSRMNFGRVIFDNILAAGFAKEKLTLIRPGGSEFCGVRCVDNIRSFDKKLDLLVVALASEQLPDIVSEVIEGDCAESVMLIAGGLGETEESVERALVVMEKIRHSRKIQGEGPVFLGANCLGVISHPGKYDTLFIPESKLPKARTHKKRNAAFVSQSGAFMITRLSKRPELDPAYMISAGNQNDLSLGDVLNYLKDDKEIDVIGVYAEGFQDMDGLNFTTALRKAVLAGKVVIFYKAGRTPEGKLATSGHTASLAGDYMVCESCIKQAGGIVASTFSEFEDLLLLSQKLHSKKIIGNRLAAVSGAGFEAVGMADNIQADDYTLRLAEFSKKTKKELISTYIAAGLGSLVSVSNPLDINPGSDDAVHHKTVTVLLKDQGVDAVVLGLDPLSPAMQTLEGEKGDKYSFSHPESIAATLPVLCRESIKPVVGVVDGGRLYDPLVDELITNEVVVFRSSDRAVQVLARYIEGRLFAEKLQRRHQLIS